MPSSEIHLILFEPEIPQNTGSLIRLSANTGAYLHLIHPLGFDLDEKKVRRAGLDYRELARVQEHTDLPTCLSSIHVDDIYALTTKGASNFFNHSFSHKVAFLFGPETRGLPDEILTQFDDNHRVFLPMQADSRSLNLANTASIVAYEAWRQMGFHPL